MMKLARHTSIKKKSSLQNPAPSTGPHGISAMLPAHGTDSLDSSPVRAETGSRSSGILALQHKNASSAVAEHSTNCTGLPDALKSGVESLSGLSLDDVRVHRNSSRPAQMQALAYTQGADIHVAPGQERHIPHEAWHVVQQKQGRVKPTMQIAGQPVNDDIHLEREADVIGSSVGRSSAPGIQNKEKATRNRSDPVTQRVMPIQRDKVSPNRIAEGQWAQVGRGGTVLFTALAAGCLAITAIFSEGGGAGIHMALDMPNRAQWIQFRDAVAAKRIRTIFLDGDMLSQDDGWYVKIDPMDFHNMTEYSPRAAAELQVEYGQNFGEAGWVNAAGMVSAWFKEVFGAENVVITETNEPVAHQCI